MQSRSSPASASARPLTCVTCLLSPATCLFNALNWAAVGPAVWPPGAVATYVAPATAMSTTTSMKRFIESPHLTDAARCGVLRLSQPRSGERLAVDFGEERVRRVFERAGAYVRRLRARTLEQLAIAAEMR